MKTAALIAATLAAALNILAGSAPIPVVRVVNELNVPPFVWDPYGYSHFVIAPDGIKATVIFDGSASTDPDGDDLTYLWGHFDEGHLIALPCPSSDSPAVLVCTVYFGDDDRERLGLTVCDTTGLCITLRFGLYVVRPADVVGFLLEDVTQLESEHHVTLHSQQALLNALTRARENFEAGDVDRAVQLLERFQQLIRKQRRSLGDELTDAFLKLSQAVIDAVSGVG